MKLTLLFVGGDKEPWLKSVQQEYLDKLNRFIKTELKILKPLSMPRASATLKREKESAAILQTIKKEDFVLLADEAGEQMSSRLFSQKIEKVFASGKGNIVVIIGGAYGFSSELRARGQWVFSLSKMTFSHHIAQAVLLEQLYRAFTIQKNIPYHND